MAQLILSVLNFITAGLSGYGLYLGYHSATSLQQYEKPSERAAKYSNTAAQQLYKTRTTQAAAICAVCFTHHYPSIISQLSPYPSFSHVLKNAKSNTFITSSFISHNQLTHTPYPDNPLLTLSHMVPLRTINTATEPVCHQRRRNARRTVLRLGLLA